MQAYQETPAWLHMTWPPQQGARKPSARHASCSRADAAQPRMRARIPHPSEAPELLRRPPPQTPRTRQAAGCNSKAAAGLATVLARSHHATASAPALSSTLCGQFGTMACTCGRLAAKRRACAVPPAASAPDHTSGQAWLPVPRMGMLPTHPGAPAALPPHLLSRGKPPFYPNDHTHTPRPVPRPAQILVTLAAWTSGLFSARRSRAAVL